MEVERKDEVLFVRLEHDEDILGSIGELVAHEHSTLVFTTGLGMIHDFELGFFENGRYITKHYDEPHELVSVQGSIASEGEPRIHIHVIVADKAHAASGGHLLSGKVWMSNELVLLAMAGVRSHRIPDPDRKIGVLHFIHGAED